MLAENPATGKVEAERVQAVRQDPVSSFMRVQLADGSSVEVTVDHPFWVDGNADFANAGWRAAGQLQIGDQLRTASGPDVMVVGLRYNVGHAVVYTLTVPGDHDFMVGIARVLVHNSDRSYFFDLEQAETKYNTHSAEFPGLTLQEFIDRAEQLANAPVGGSVLEHQGSDLTIVRFDTRTGEFLVADSTNGEIVTFFKPPNGLRYYLNDIKGR